MSNEIAKASTFQERMFEQIRSQMGDLLTEEELKDILSTSIEKAFFSARTSGTGYNKTEKEPLFIELVRTELTPAIEKGAKQWVLDNQDRIDEILQKQLGDNAAAMVANAFSCLMAAPLQQFSFDLQSRLSAQNINL